MTKHNPLRWGAALAALAATIAGGGQAHAQQPPAAPAADEDEIVVTARRTEETLLTVPLAVTAIGEVEIENSGIDSVSDLALLTPGFSFRQGFGRSGGDASERPSIRGMSSILGEANAAFFVDGIFVSGNIQSYQLDNLERIEVIRGPQSALFGRQSFAGAVNFVTRAPGDETEARVSATVGEWAHFETNGYISGPLVKGVLSGEINGRIYSFGGDYLNGDSLQRDIGEQESLNAGGKLRWTPVDAFTATLNVGYARDHDESFPYGFLGSNQLNCFQPNIIGTVLGIPRSSTQSRGYYCGELKLPQRFAWNSLELNELGFRGVTRETYRYSLKMDLDLGGFTLSSSSAYNEAENANAFDNTLTPSNNPSFSISGSSVEDISQDLRLISPQDRPFRFQIGAYYYKEEAGTGFSFNQTTRVSTFFESADAVTNKAVYGMVELDLSDRLTLTAEARTQEDEIEATGLFSPTGPAGVRSVTYDATLPRVTGRYTVNDDLMFYAVAAKGNKPGGFNTFPVDMLFADQQAFVARGFSAFDEEEAWSYEIGSKGQLGPVNFAVAGFYTDWQQQQLTRSEPYELFLASNPARTTPRSPRAFATTPFIINAGESEIFGGEIELFGNLTDWLSYRLGYAYANAEFVDFYDENAEEIFDTDGRPSTDPLDVDGPTGQLAGNKLPQTPEHQFNFSGTARKPITDGLSLFFRSDYSYESKRYVQADNLAWVGDSHNLNLRSGIEGDRWQLTFFLNNALDDDTPLVATRLLDFNRTLLVPDPVRRFAGQPLRLTFYRDFSLSAPRRRAAGATFTVNF